MREFKSSKQRKRESYVHMYVHYTYVYTYIRMLSNLFKSEL